LREDKSQGILMADNKEDILEDYVNQVVHVYNCKDGIHQRAAGLFFRYDSTFIVLKDARCLFSAGFIPINTFEISAASVDRITIDRKNLVSITLISPKIDSASTKPAAS
jgi:hypothetical protein